jgi:hypothetical protein
MLQRGCNCDGDCDGEGSCSFMLLPLDAPELVKLDIDKQMMFVAAAAAAAAADNSFDQQPTPHPNLTPSACATTRSAAVLPSKAAAMHSTGQQA